MGLSPEIAEQEIEAKSCEELLSEYHERYRGRELPRGEIINFITDENVGKIIAPNELTGYNPALIMVHDQPHLLIRLESRQSETDSEIALFEEVNGRWVLDESAPIFPGQDPFYCGLIQGQHVFGNVEVHPDPKNPKILMYRTVFRRYQNDFSEITDKNGQIATPFAVGPERMKDIRLIDLQNGKIGVFTRPQEEGFGGLGKIGYFEIDSIDQLESGLANHIQTKDTSKLIPNICRDDEWVGANQLHLLENNRIGVLGHIARYREENGQKVKDYFPITFVFDPNRFVAANLQILLTAKSFPDVPTKKEDLGEVIYSGGLRWQPDGRCDFYGGHADTVTVQAPIDNPFAEAV